MAIIGNALEPLGGGVQNLQYYINRHFVKPIDINSSNETAIYAWEANSQQYRLVLTIYGNLRLDYSNDGTNWTTHGYCSLQSSHTTSGVQTSIVAGNSYSFDGLQTGGYRTNSGNQFSFMIPIRVPVYATSVTITAMKGAVRQNGVYLIGDGTESTDFLASGYMGECRLRLSGISCAYMNTGTISGGTNNDAVGIKFTTLTIKFS